MPRLGWRFLHLLSIATLAITQPLLGILGDNPTFFTAHSSTPGQVIWFALLVSVVPATLAATLEAGTRIKYRYEIHGSKGPLALEGTTHAFTVPYAPGPFDVVDTFEK